MRVEREQAAEGHAMQIERLQESYREEMRSLVDSKAELSAEYAGLYRTQQVHRPRLQLHL